MKLLVDSNVFLEILLQQENQEVARQALDQAEQHEYFVSDFALHSICLIVIRRRSIAVLETFLAETILTGAVTVLPLATVDLREVLDTMQLLGLDFDDAYQYTLAEKNNLVLVSFDSDFNGTPRGRMTPQAINQLTESL